MMKYSHLSKNSPAGSYRLYADGSGIVTASKSFMKFPNAQKKKYPGFPLLSQWKPGMARQGMIHIVENRDVLSNHGLKTAF